MREQQLAQRADTIAAVAQPPVEPEAPDHRLLHPLIGAAPHYGYAPDFETEGTDTVVEVVPAPASDTEVAHVPAALPEVVPAPPAAYVPFAPFEGMVDEDHFGVFGDSPQLLPSADPMEEEDPSGLQGMGLDGP